MVAASSALSRETYPQIAGDVALDFVNTVSWRLNAERRIEHLLDYGDLLRWAEQVRLVDSATRGSLERLAAADPAAAALEWRDVLALREALYEAAFEGGSTDPVVREHAAAIAAGRLERSADAWAWEFAVDLTLLRRRIALAAIALLLRDDLDRLGQCSDADCGWVFLDTSPRRNRRWCVASDCGNRNRVREHYARVRTGAATH